MRLPIRFTKTIWLLLLYIPVSKKLPSLNDNDTNAHIQRFHTRLARILGINTIQTGRTPNHPCLVVSNHVSWHDVMVIGQHTQPDFVAKAEVSKWPIIGEMARLAGTLYIDRGNRQAATSITQTISNQLERRSVLVFPESTTTPGDVILPFKRRLFQAAYDANSPIQPVALHYEGRDKKGRLLGYGNESFLGHVIRTMRTKEFTVHIHFCEPFMPIDGHIRESALEAENRIRTAKSNIEKTLTLNAKNTN